MKQIKKAFGLILFLVLSISCSEDYTIIKPESKVIVSVSSSFTLINQEVTFTAKLIDSENESIDITNECVFYVNSIAQTNNSFTSNSIGDFFVTAVYNQKESQKVFFTYHDGSQVLFKKRVLIEDYTGTWCGWCTRVSYGIDLVHNSTDNAVSVAIHRGSTNPIAIDYDPYNYDTSLLENILVNNFSFNSGYPKAALNRTTKWNTPEPDNIDQVLNLTQGDNPKLGLAINSSLNGNNISIDVKTKFSNNFNNLKLVVYILENELVYSQKNYTSYYGSINPINYFVHNHVLRDCKTDIMGDPIPNTETFSGNIYTKSFTFNTPSNIQDINKVDIVAFVVSNSGTVLNVRNSHLNENQEFEEL